MHKGVRIVIAPDKFKGSLPAADVALAVAAGVKDVLPDAQVALFPMADGGEGSLDALVRGARERLRYEVVSGPLAEPVRAPFALLDHATAALEMAAASGLSLIDEPERDAFRATSRGTGELLLHAADAIPRATAHAQIIVGVGGSASSDGGVGAASAIGWRFLDRLGQELPPGGGSLRALASIDGTRVSRVVERCSIVGACDVDNPLVGPDGAAAVFAPQKGASAGEVGLLSEGLATLAERISSELGIHLGDAPHAGAGGGFGAGLIAFFGGVLRPGARLVADQIGLTDEIQRADLVITGEGRVDATSARGKTPRAVAEIAARASVACWIVAGEITLPHEALAAWGIGQTVALVDCGHSGDLADPRALLRDATAQLLRDHYT